MFAQSKLTPMTLQPEVQIKWDKIFIPQSGQLQKRAGGLGSRQLLQRCLNASAFHSNAAQMPWVAHDTRVNLSPGSRQNKKET